MDNIFIGIDLGGSYIKIGYGGQSTAIESSRSVRNEADDRASLLAFLKQTITDTIEAIPSENYKLRAIGLGSPGIIDHSSGKVAGNCPNIKGWVGADPKGYLEEHFRVPVVIENDADMMVMGEYSTGKFKNQNLLGLTIGTGIGTGYVYKGTLFTGRFTALEAGHTVVQPQGIRCSCGKHGCLEAYSSVKSILTRITKETGKELSLDEAFSLYLNKTEPVKSIIDSAYQMLGLAISNLVYILSPDVILIGGGMTESPLFDINNIADKTTEYLQFPHQKNIKILTASLKNKAGIAGAIYHTKRMQQT